MILYRCKVYGFLKASIGLLLVFYKGPTSTAIPYSYQDFQHTGTQTKKSCGYRSFQDACFFITIFTMSSQTAEPNNFAGKI